MAADRPKVNLQWQRQWCPTHREPFRANWPEGTAIAMLRLFEAAVEDPRMVEQTGGKAANLHAVMGEFAPLCCWIEPGALSAIYAEAGVEAEAIG